MSAPEGPTVAALFVPGALLTVLRQDAWPAAVGRVERIVDVRELDRGRVVEVVRLDGTRHVGPALTHRIPADRAVEWGEHEGERTATFPLAVNYRATDAKTPPGWAPPAFPSRVTYRISPPSSEETRAA